MPGASRLENQTRFAPNPRFLLYLLLSSLVVLLTARIAAAVSITSVSVTPSPVTMQLGDAQQFRAFVNYSDGSVQEITQSAEWTTGSSKIAIVSKTPGSIGVVTATGPGMVKINASIVVGTKKPKGSADLTVVAPAIASITTRPTTKKLEIGMDSQFRATANYVNEFTADVTDSVDWSSSNPAVATVENTGADKGLVHPLAVGTTTITAHDPVSGMSNTDGATIVRAEVTDLSVEPKDVTLPRKVRFPMRCFANRADGTRSNITSDADWGSTNNAAITVGQGAQDGGVVVGVANGTATIHCSDPQRNLSTVTSGGGSNVTVSGRLIGLSVPSITLAVGDQKSAKAIGKLSSGIDSSDLSDAVVWSIDGPAVASVGNTDANRGEVTGLGSGTTTLRAFEPATQTQSQDQDNLSVLGALQGIAMETGDGLLGVGETTQFKVRATYAGNVTSNISDKCDWSIDKPRLATVDNTSPGKGTITGLRKGKAVISANCNGQTLTGNLQVIGRLQSLEISPSSYDAEAQTDKKFHALGNYVGGLQRDLSKVVDWTSSDPTVLQIDGLGDPDPGYALLLKAGGVVITASYAAKSLTATAPVTVSPGVLSIEIVPHAATVRGSVAVRLRAQGRRADNSIKPLTKLVVWSSDDPNIARVTNQVGKPGTAYGGKQEGTTTIRATLTPDLVATASITTKALLVSFELIPETRTLQRFKAAGVTAKAQFSDGAKKVITRNVTYSSSNTAAVIVSNDAGSEGVMTAVGPGQAVISATDPSSGIAATNTVSVTVP